jgi:hypothetical protein
MRATRHHRVFESGQTHSAHRSCTDARSIPFLAIDDDLGSCATVALSHSERLARAARSAELMVLRRGGPQPLSGGGRSADNGATGTASWGQRRWRIPFGSSGASLHFRAPVFCSPPSLRVATAETICGSSGSATAIAPLLPDGLSGFGWRWEVELGAWDLTLLDHQDSPLALAGNAIGNRQREGRVSGRVAGDIDPVCLTPPAIDQHFADPGWPW